MSNAIAFFPWTSVQSAVSVGPLRLLPYKKGRLPGDQPFVTQADIDGVLSAYADRPNQPIQKGALLELGQWQSGMDVSDEQASLLFRARHLLAFSALSERELFHRHFDYANFDTYALMIQRYNPESPGTFAFSTRRRDGRTQHLWGSDDFAFHRPNHVDSRARISFDEGLLAALLALPTDHEHVYEAIVEFNQANTDSSDVPRHVEAVMCKSAFEWLLQTDSNAKSFVKALEARLADVEPVECSGPLVEKWNARWQHESRLLHAWAKDFCAVRGTSAHGVTKPNFVWSNHQHLAFIATVFPLLVKKVLADGGLAKLDERDGERLRRIESYLAHDPFDFDWLSDKTHPWSEIASEVRLALLAKRLYPYMN